MEGNRRTFLNKHSTSEEFSENSHSSDTVYRILCQSTKIGCGSIVKSLREETQAKITISDSVPGSDERVITIYSPSDKQAKRQSAYNGREYDVLEPHCAAQDALLRVHERIAEEDLGGAGEKNRSETVVSARLLVSSHMVGCLLGREGDVIQKLRSETGANIRVLPADHLPACCATSNYELVQVSGKPAIVKKALYEVSTLLHKNPWRDKPSLSHSRPYDSHEFHGYGPPLRTMLPPGNPPWSERTMDAHRMQPLPFEGRYGIHPSELVSEDLDGVAQHDHEATCEFTIKILCSATRIGSVIGKGGSNVKQLEEETGASIYVENASKESDEIVIRVSSFEVLWDQRSKTIDAILHLQNKTNECSEDGTTTTRLLVPSSKVGCLLGQGGHVISDMRRRTHADIRVFSKKEKPKCASEDEELVQISGSFGIAKDALIEIASRLRTRCLHDVNTRGGNSSGRPLPGFGPPENLHSSGRPLSSTTVAGSSGRYQHTQDSAHEFDSPSFPLPTRATGYSDFNEARFSSVSATTRSRISEVFAATRARHQDPSLSELREKIEVQKKRLDEATYSISALEAEVEQTRSERVEATLLKEYAETELEKARQKDNEAQAEIAFLKLEVYKGRLRLDAAEAAEIRAQGEKTTLYNALQQMRLEAEETKNENRMLKEEASKLKLADPDMQIQLQQARNQIEKVESVLNPLLIEETNRLRMKIGLPSLSTLPSSADMKDMIISTKNLTDRESVKAILCIVGVTCCGSGPYLLIDSLISATVAAFVLAISFALFAAWALKFRSKDALRVGPTHWSAGGFINILVGSVFTSFIQVLYLKKYCSIWLPARKYGSFCLTTFS